VRTVGIFNIFVGLMLTVALLTYALGFVMWVVRLGTWPSYRTEAVKIMEWSVAILFVLVVLLIIVQFFQMHTQAGLWILSAIVIIGIVWLIIWVLMDSGGEKEEKEEKEEKPAAKR
jgi:hypothetical protein